jgi:hypothetical protein
MEDIAEKRHHLPNRQLVGLIFGPLLARAALHPDLKAASEAAFNTLNSAAASPEAALRAWSMVHGLAHLLVDRAIPVADADSFINRVISPNPKP